MEARIDSIEERLEGMTALEQRMETMTMVLNEIRQNQEHGRNRRGRRGHAASREEDDRGREGRGGVRRTSTHWRQSRDSGQSGRRRQPSVDSHASNDDDDGSRTPYHRDGRRRLELPIFSGMTLTGG